MVTRHQSIGAASSLDRVPEASGAQHLVTGRGASSTMRAGPIPGVEH